MTPIPNKSPTSLPRFASDLQKLTDEEIAQLQQAGFEISEKTKIIIEAEPPDSILDLILRISRHWLPDVDLLFIFPSQPEWSKKETIPDDLEGLLLSSGRWAYMATATPSHPVAALTNEVIGPDLANRLQKLRWPPRQPGQQQ